MKNVVEVSISISSKIEVTEELKSMIRNRFPFISYKTDEDYAIVALFEASDNCLPKFVSWGGVEMPLDF